MHSIELLLDPESDRAIRRQWARLADAGLPSQARHTGDTNAPHITLAARERLGAEFDVRLGAVAASLPVPVGLGALVVFGRPPRGLVLARLAVVTPRLLRLHAAVHEVLGDGPDAAHTLPGHWTPHVTLASRLTSAQLAEAVEVLRDDDAALAAAGATALRRWDSTARTVTPLTPAVQTG
ncbi:2'-5' RNA ligase family protein [Frondihabitans australicus]|uniref:2'-5' RNA ligase n=1 Tax=Frondihabitans australicus TaxID=386892 RepID=A0A495IC75_9MICO|nr:2'-5' RNA ligase family protein [Frondihabitans australicus]RKR73078.1 2'-5' RNA ligase [Frondihabitans australicus]